MSNLTITEALAEIKTVTKRISSKREFIKNYLVRYEGLKDPLEKDGGSPKVLAQEQQSLADLEERIVGIRAAIQAANEATPITLEGKTDNISNWLIWRREVAPQRLNYLTSLHNNLVRARNDARQKGQNVYGVNVVQTDKQPTDIIVNIDEKALTAEIEQLNNILGQLDGQLSLKNATVMVEI